MHVEHRLAIVQRVERIEDIQHVVTLRGNHLGVSGVAHGTVEDIHASREGEYHDGLDAEQPQHVRQHAHHHESERSERSRER